MVSWNKFINRYTFSDAEVYRAAITALLSCFGPFEGWDKAALKDSRRFLAAVCPFTAGAFSLSSLKAALKEQRDEMRLHRIAYHFMVAFRDSYVAEDSLEFREVFWIMMDSGRAYRVLFHDDVRSFRNVVYCHYYNQPFFCIVRTENDYLLSLFRRFVRDSLWSLIRKPTRKSLDCFFSLVEDLVSPNHVISALSFDQERFFDLIDRANASGEYRDEFILYIIRLYRFGIRNEGFSFAGMPIFNKRLLDKDNTVTFFLDEYTDRRKVCVFVARGKGHEGFLVNLDTDNPYLRAALGALLLSGKVSQEEYRACRNTFMDSFGGLSDTVGSPDCPFDEDTLMNQVNYYRQLYDNNSRNRSMALSFIKAFYFKVNELLDGEFFRKTHTITYSIFSSQAFVFHLDQGFEFRRYSEFDRVTEGKRIIFIVHGFNNTCRRLLREDHIVIDYSAIRNPFYRSLAWRFTTSTKGRLYRRSYCGVLRLVFPYLVNIKRSVGYPTPSLEVFSVWDAIMLVDYFEKVSDCVVTFNNRIRDFGAFLRWAKSSKAMIVDDTSLKEILIRKRHSNIPTNTPTLSDEEIISLAGYFAEKAADNMQFGQMLILFTLLVITPLRIGHLCSLIREELVYEDKLGFYVVRSTNKSTRGGIGEIVLGGRADDLIRKALKISEQVGLGCAHANLRDQIFLYSYNNKYYVFTPSKFWTLLYRACQACGIPHYTSRNIRATYMTKAYIEASENGYANEFMLKLFSYHKRTGTTLEHYVNHCEALGALTDYLKRGQDWHKMIYPDEIAALQAVIDEYFSLIDETDDQSEKDLLRQELYDYEMRLKQLKA